jgi:phosphopantetheinyl transferase
MKCLDRLFSVDELAGDGKPPRGALSSAEEDRYRSFCNSQTARLWLAGRLAAKNILSELLAIPFAGSELHIESRDGQNRKIRPRAYLRGRLQPWSLSIAHIENHVFVAAADENIRLGADAAALGAINAHTAAFWFTPGETEWCRGDFAPVAHAVVWTLKEACYKAENRGEPFMPRQLDVRPRLPDPALFREISCANRPSWNWTWQRDGRWYAVRADDRIMTTLCVARC